jgi:hypothetical protein
MAGFAYWTPDDHPLAERFAAHDSLHPTTLQEYIGNFGWSGSSNTYFWGDPREALVGIIWAQSHQRKYYYPLERQFITLAYQALVD